MDIRKIMEFILEQQAATAAAAEVTRATVDKLVRVVEDHENDIQTHTEWLTGISRAIDRFAAAGAALDEKMRELTASQNRTDLSLFRLSEKQAALTEAQAKTDAVIREAQLRTEASFARLSEARARTEATMNRLAGG